ncbi:hypothetical protein [Thalassovita mediterranea]|uniref:Uncharacterized protein n=1 Tax=Thalassovita mediterranea TaxID=340021 RepID=A0A0P1GL70_9RHOB|nr:hypothetical protein [Thalassovita mediterranea]CUH83054.1 hypothetical protein TM5383_00236 [Thalassovita mediterranea]SIS31180.1 hypothetical protein SAMN05421685_10436 [Thalassovita mediterranea]
MPRPLVQPAALCCVALLLSAQSAQATAPNICAPRDKVVDKLATDYGESRQSIGLGRDNAVVEVFASTSSGTWTITVTRADGMTCLVASGQAFETLAEAAPAGGSAL